jgi:hypothetical protein
MHNKVAKNDSLPVKTRYSKKGNDNSRYMLMALGKFQIFSFWGVDFSGDIMSIFLLAVLMFKTIS